jgi:hypothetical protein
MLYKATAPAKAPEHVRVRPERDAEWEMLRGSEYVSLKVYVRVSIVYVFL